MWWKRWEPLLEQKPRDGVDVVKDLIAKEIDEVLDTFPPPDIELEDPRLRQRLQGRIHELPRVDDGLRRLILELVELDLVHETDRIDHLFRNQLHREAAPTQDHVDVLHLLWRGILEHLYARKDETRGLLKTRDLVDVVGRCRRARRDAPFAN